MLDLEAAFTRLREKEDSDAKAEAERKQRIADAIEQYGSECKKMFGGKGKVTVEQHAHGIMLNAGKNGWAMIKFEGELEKIVRLSTKPSDVLPVDPGIKTYETIDDDSVADRIAAWYRALPPLE